MVARWLFGSLSDMEEPSTIIQIWMQGKKTRWVSLFGSRTFSDGTHSKPKSHFISGCYCGLLVLTSKIKENQMNIIYYALLWPGGTSGRVGGTYSHTRVYSIKNFWFYGYFVFLFCFWSCFISMKIFHNCLVDCLNLPTSFFCHLNSIKNYIERVHTQ